MSIGLRSAPPAPAPTARGESWGVSCEAFAPLRAVALRFVSEGATRRAKSPAADTTRIAFSFAPSCIDRTAARISSVRTFSCEAEAAAEVAGLRRPAEASSEVEAAAPKKGLDLAAEAARSEEDIVMRFPPIVAERERVVPAPEAEAAIEGPLRSIGDDACCAELARPRAGEAAAEEGPPPRRVVTAFFSTARTALVRKPKGFAPLTAGVALAVKLTLVAAPPWP